MKNYLDRVFFYKDIFYEIERKVEEIGGEG